MKNNRGNGCGLRASLLTRKNSCRWGGGGENSLKRVVEQEAQAEFQSLRDCKSCQEEKVRITSSSLGTVEFSFFLCSFRCCLFCFGFFGSLFCVFLYRFLLILLLCRPFGTVTVQSFSNRTQACLDLSSILLWRFRGSVKLHAKCREVFNWGCLFY